MKKFFVLAILIGSSSGFADKAYRLRLPLTLSCTSTATSSAVQKFEIEMEMNKDPYIALDASFIEKTVSNEVFSLAFSNQCDNAYTISFDSQKLSALSESQEESPKIKGTLIYFDAHLNDAKGEEVEEQANVTCVKMADFVQTKRQQFKNAEMLIRYLRSANANRIECKSQKGQKLIVEKGFNDEDQTGLVVLGDFQYGTNEIKQISIGETSMIKFGEEGNYQFVFELTENPKQFGQIGAAYVVSEGDTLDTLSCKLK